MIIFHSDSKAPFSVTEGLDPVATLKDDATAVAWSKEGDRMSAENTTVLTNCEC